MLSIQNPVLHIAGIEQMQWNGGSFHVAPRDFAVLAYRIKGDAVIRAGENTYEIQSGDILYLPQNMAYSAKYGNTDLIAIHFVTARDDGEIKVYPKAKQLSPLFLRAREIWEKREPGYTTFAIAQLYTILGNLEELTAKKDLPAHFLKALAFINSHYTDKSINVDTICSRAGMGGTTFRQLFKKHYHKTPTEYVTLLRLEHARSMIAGGSTVEHAAFESGFSDPKYFARVVKKVFGCTPRDFKSYGK